MSINSTCAWKSIIVRLIHTILDQVSNEWHGFSSESEGLPIVWKTFHSGYICRVFLRYGVSRGCVGWRPEWTSSGSTCTGMASLRYVCGRVLVGFPERWTPSDISGTSSAYHPPLVRTWSPWWWREGPCWEAGMLPATAWRASVSGRVALPTAWSRGGRRCRLRL